MKKLGKYWRFLSHCLLLTAILARWQQPVAFVIALNHLYPAMRAVSYQRIAMAIKMASKQGVFSHRRCFACDPGVRWGNMERVVTQWQRPVASGVAMDVLHWAMPHVLLQRLCMAIKMACNGGTFTHCHRFFA